MMVVIAPPLQATTRSGLDSAQCLCKSFHLVGQIVNGSLKAFVEAGKAVGGDIVAMIAKVLHVVIVSI